VTEQAYRPPGTDPEPAPADTPTTDDAPPRASSSSVTVRAARQGAIGLVGALCAGLGGLALTVTVGRVLDREHAGVYFTVVALFTIVSTVLVLGTDTGLVRDLPAMRARGAAGSQRQLVLIALRPVLVISVVAVVVVELVAGRVAAATVGDDLAPQLATAVRLVAPALVLATVTQVLLSGAARGLGSLRTYTAIQQIMLPATRPLLVLVAVLAVGDHRDGAMVALAAWALPLLVAAALAAADVHRRLPARELAGGPPFGWPPSEPYDPATAPVPDGHEPGLAGSFWRATAPRAVAATFEILIVWADVVLVTVLVGPSWGAVYAAASRFVTSGTFALQAVRLSIAPLLSGAFARGDTATASAVHRLSVRWALLSTWPVYLALAAFAPGVLTVLGHGYTQAATALSILSLAMLGVVATGNANTVLNMAHRSHWAAGNTGFATVLMLGIDLALVPHLGIVGAALGWSTAMLTDACLGVAEVRWGLGLASFDGSTRRAAVAALAGFGAPALLVRLTDSLVLRGSVPAGVVLLVGTALAGLCYLLVLVRHRHELELGALVAALRRRPAEQPAAAPAPPPPAPPRPPPPPPPPPTTRPLSRPHGGPREHDREDPQVARPRAGQGGCQGGHPRLRHADRSLASTARLPGAGHQARRLDLGLALPRAAPAGAADGRQVGEPEEPALLLLALRQGRGLVPQPLPHPGHPQGGRAAAGTTRHHRRVEPLLPVQPVRAGPGRP